jgi:hypothetical protein
MNPEILFCDTCEEDVSDEKLEHCRYLRHELLEKPKKSIEDLTEKEENTSEKIYKFIKTKIKKCIVLENDSSQVFALIENNGHIETLDLSSTKAKSLFRYSYYSQTGNNHSEDTYTSALLLVKAEAMHGGAPRETIFNRIAMIGDAIYYDLITPDWKALKITKDSVKIVPLDLSSPIFVRTQSQISQIMPVFDGKNALDDLVVLLRVRLEEKQIFIVHIISMFLEGFPIPIMSIIGEHGSIKSTISKSVKQIVDPSGSKTISMSGKTEDLILLFHNRYCVCIDNVSKINQNTSDILCKAVTGDGNAKRKLYTDSDEIIYSYKRKIILNGISPNLEYPDLVDRNITYVTEKVSDAERITEEEFNKKFNDLLPLILGQIFQTLSDTMKIYNSVKIEIKSPPRMADFAIWGECISRTLGYDPLSFINYYKDKIKILSLETNESYPIISIVGEMLKDRDSYEATVQEFYNTIKIHAESNGIDINSRHVNFPKAPNKIKEHVTRLKQNFRTMEFEIDIAPYTKRDGLHPRNRQVIYITKIKNTIAYYDEHPPLPPLPSLPDAIQEQINDMVGSDTGRDKLVQTALSLPYLAKSPPDFPIGQGGNHGRDTFGMETK